jgi:hypothetical protein
MGMNLGLMIFLQNQGYLTNARNRILDIGPQNVYHTTNAQIEEFVRAQGIEVGPDRFKAEMERLVHFSSPRPGERTTFFSEICDLTNIEYNSFDVCPGLKTELLDLNYDLLPDKYTNYYDVVLNFGTTEHVFNQWNSFKIMHEAVKVGGIVYHQLPSTGYLDHGYFCYTPIFFRDIAKANGYEILEMFLTPAGENLLNDLAIDVRADGAGIAVANSGRPAKGADRVPCFNIHCILRKVRSAPFKVALEIATAHASAYAGVLNRYDAAAYAEAPRAAAATKGMPGANGAEGRIAELVADRERRIAELTADRERKVGQLVREREEARGRAEELAIRLRAMEQSRSWRYLAPVRRIAGRFYARPTK